MECEVAASLVWATPRIPLAGITDSLYLAVFFFELPLHIEVQLPFSLHSLLLHISNDALVHHLSNISARYV